MIITILLVGIILFILGEDGCVRAIMVTGLFVITLILFTSLTKDQIQELLNIIAALINLLK